MILEKNFKRNYVHIRDVADCFLYAIENEILFDKLVIEDLNSFVPNVKSSDLKEASIERSIANRNSKGGSSLTSIKRQLRIEKKKLGGILWVRYLF